MLRTLGITTAIRWLLVAMVALAIWRGFEGDLGAIADKVIQIVVRGAEVVTQVFAVVMGAVA